MRTQSHAKFLLIGLSTAAVVLFCAAPAFALQYRTVPGDNQTFYDWRDSSRWQFFYQPWWAWVSASWFSMPPPGPADEAIIMCNMDIPPGVAVTVGTLRVGCNDCPSNAGWVFFPSNRHVLRVRGELTVLKNSYVWDDTLEIAGGSLTNRGLFFVGNMTGYQQPVSDPLEACRRSMPCLRMWGEGARLLCRFDAAASNSVYSGGLVFWPGAIEEITGGRIEVEGWLIGADDLSCPWAPTPRRFDLAAPAESRVTLAFTGSAYPSTLPTPTVYVQDEAFGVSPHPLRCRHLVVDRRLPGATAVDWISELEVSGDVRLLGGHLRGPVPRRLAFTGPDPCLWETSGDSSYGVIVPDLDGKEGPVTLKSTLEIPLPPVDNPCDAFELRVDPSGALCGEVTLLGGRLVFSAGVLEVRGGLRVAGSGAARAPELRMDGSAVLWVRHAPDLPGSGDVRLEAGSRGRCEGGVIRAEGDFFVDTLEWHAGSAHTLELTGNALRAAALGSLRTPPGLACPTLILQNLTVNKALPAPGDEVWAFSDVIVGGRLQILGGRLNWNRDGVGVLILRPGAGAPALGPVAAGSADVAVLHVLVETGPEEPVYLHSLTVSALGSGDDAADLAGIRLHLDVDGDGRFDPAVDAPLAGPAFFDRDDGTATFPMARILPAGRREGWFVTAGFYDAAVDGSTFLFLIESDRALVTAGTVSNRSVDVWGSSVTGETFLLASAGGSGAAAPGAGCAGGGAPGSWAGYLLLFAGLCALATTSQRFAAKKPPSPRNTTPA